ncbi:YchJ family protein [Sphaerotilus sp.]|uniref:YchJ family protein n=1 Tax=Sphaerotilus sp. TaxID=2093942 RepID=UPI0034E1C813
MTMPSDFACPCGSGHLLSACCGRYHAGPPAEPAPTAEALMRSRYSAFVLDRLDYLLATWHPDTRPATLEPNEPGLRWLGLTVRHHRVLDANHAEVSFVARSKLGGRAHRLEEVSRFVHEDGRWFYVDGDTGGRISGEVSGRP